ncbi:redoxin domain-containing protein [Pedobacter psychroterrae]|uniref:TlpA family protein disulfide reductase n=1 Tax=Pedobacter psychroterrae TaxID=2530453 RepID=A0A4R0NFZ4_9SPHI|nr:redoxin domain-containing protein [Pedobacter psychroterrae]TCC98142.1 TlpA family protein disulfide reductase [Pedobacter psychroterrae]
MKSLLTLLIAACATTALSQQINVPKNKEFEIKSTNKNAGPYITDEEYVYAFKSLGKNAEGNSLFECKIVKVLIKDKNSPGGVLLNTDSVRKTNFYSTAVLLPLAMLNQPFTVTVSPKGRILGISDRAEYLKKRLGEWKIEQQYIDQTLSNADGDFASRLQSLFLELPDQKIALSSEWKSKNADVPFKVTGSQGGNMVINSNVKQEDGTVLNSKYVINTKTGIVESAMSTSKGPQINYTGTQKLGNRILRSQTDSSWVNMAVKMSYWSESLKKGTVYDSVKVNQLLNNKNNERFANDPYFLLNRLNATQGLDGPNSHLLYYKLLVDIPNEVIKNNPSHLHNKLGEALSQRGAAEAYEVSKYALKTSSFDDWIQHSFAQGFLVYDHNNADETARRKKHYELAALFHKTKDPLYQLKTNALYLWATAKNEKENVPLLVSTASAFEKMSDEEMKTGNGSRYSLMVYKMLLDAKKPVEADSLLNKTIAKLEKYAADTLNVNRFAEQNMLAGAYYFKYQQAEAAANPDAMTYLSKAAQYSPKTPKEKAHSSFYDRVFIKNKETYRQEFIDKLMSNGNEELALKVFEEHINAEPDNVEEMHALYTKRFPDKDFNKFFVNNIMGGWKPAPAFELTTIDGKKHLLENFKDKWLVLDFWGTWCGPCRAEMPTVNKFSEEVAAGKHEGVEFLSIACRDSEKSVKAYMEANKFSMPVAISKGDVEKNFKIRGFPSKILIAPDGRMMNVEFGKNWQKVLQQYSKLYANSR